MSSSWRIRHKLMLGLVLAVGVLALLLCGTLRGLWSYYLTTDSIRGKLKELKAAEDFKECVTQLTSPDGPETPAREPQRPGHQESLQGRSPEALGLRVSARRQSEPGAGRHDLGPHRHGLAQVLLTLIAELEEAVNKVAAIPKRDALTEDEDCRGQEARSEAAGMPMPGAANGGGEGGDDKKPDPKLVLKEKADLLSGTARDLQTGIHLDLSESLGETRRHYQVSLWIIVPTSVAGLVLLLGLMRSFYTWIMYPIRDLNAGVSRVAAGDFAHRIEINSGDEMQDLSAAFNDMTSHLQTLYSDLARQVNERSRQLVRSERLAGVGFLAAGVAHEINNPLASIAFCSEALEARLTGSAAPGARVAPRETSWKCSPAI